MKVAKSTIASALIYFLLLIALASSRQAFANCGPPIEKSLKLMDADVANCGDISWELQVAFGGDPDGPYDEGEYDGTGTCTGGFYNCQCGMVAGSYLSPTKTFYQTETYSDPETMTYDYNWYWNITNYLQPYITTCGSGPCQGDGYYTQTNYTWVDLNQGYDNAEEICTDF